MGTPDESQDFLEPGRLASAAVAFFAIATAGPIAALTVVPAAFAGGGGPLVPLTFAGVGIVLLIFAVAYTAMARRIPFAGAMFSYVSRGLGRPVGVGAGWIAVISYSAIQLGLYGIAGAAASPVLHDWFHIGEPWWVVAAACWVFVSLLGTIRAEVASGVVALIALAEVALVTGYSAADVAHPSGYPALIPSGIAGGQWSAVGALLATGVLAFVGFETAGCYAEETMLPRRQAGRAAYGTILVLMVIFAGSAWATSVAAGPGHVGALAAAHGSETMFGLASARLSSWVVTLGRFLLVTGIAGAALGLHYTVTRYLFALGRESVLPRFLAQPAPRTGLPRAASLTQSVLAAAGIVAGYIWAPAHPEEFARKLIVWGGLGVLLLITATAVAALVHLNRVRENESVGVRFFAPILSTVALGGLCWLAFRGQPVRVPILAGGVLAIGMVQALMIKTAAPVTYAGIGHAGTPIVITPKPLEPFVPALTSASDTAPAASDTAPAVSSGLALASGPAVGAEEVTDKTVVPNKAATYGGSSGGDKKDKTRGAHRPETVVSRKTPGSEPG